VIKEEKLYRFEWQHGPAPGLAFYHGVESAYGPDIQVAMERAKRAVCRRGSFQPGCITIKAVEFKE
jgi:hypothetical protein